MVLTETYKYRIALTCVLVLLMGLWSCATSGPEPGSKQWSCDARADQAVEKGDWELADLRHQEYLGADPGNCLAIYHSGYIRGRLGDREMEIEQYVRAADCGYDKDDQLYFNLGMAYAELDRAEDAIMAFERATALNAKNADNHFGLGVVARAAGRLDLARQALTKAVEVDARHWDARIELARLDLDQSRLEDARVQLEAIQQGAPNHEALPVLWRIYYDRKITALEPGGK